ncbi:hypothetical protein ACIPSA_36840 [Streptomyces sp. NPDC086549]|uniref:hypothetical protein n=1 Tax=Streptomyces sp. NPDC086549 TaxID=3365752 RepID=UPI0038125433
MFTKKETHFVVLNDLDKARAALQEALGKAERDEAPGLRRALEIVDGIGAGGDPRVRWAREVLAGQGIDPRAREVHAVKALREALPGLSLVAAVDLVRQCQAAAA